MLPIDKKALLHNILLSCCYGLFFIVFKISEFREFFVGKKVFSSFSIVDFFFNLTLFKITAWYISSFFVLYVLLAVVCGYVALEMIGHVKCEKRTRKLLCHLYLICVLYLISILNAIIYPNSVTLQLNMLNNIIAGVITIVILLSLFIFPVRLLKKWMMLNPRLIVKCVGVLGVILMFFFVMYNMVLSKENEITENTRPNIIILSIDSLVPTLTNIDKKTVSITPNIDRFLEQATVFENAWTPFARTYPAWMSLLTGTYPVKNGARYNLIDPELLNKKNVYLPDFLKQQGYQTLFGSDEKRFSNIDQQYGFDTLIGPQMGAADFLLAPILDTPLTNLIVNTRLGKIFFPYNHSNRAIHITYQPETFVQNVKQAINHLTGKPVFLSLHLCLPHWPYSWAEKKTVNNKDLYLESVVRVDKQFGNIFSLLEQKKMIENALVIVISDHGEREYPLNDDSQLVFLSEIDRKPLETRMSGHGNYVIDKAQSRIVLGIRGFGKVQNSARVTAQPASLIDIFPSITEVIGIKDDDQLFDGISLAPWIFYPKNPRIKERFLFFESGYNPGGLAGVKNIFSKNGDLGKIVATGIGSYRIKQNGRIVLKKELLDELNTQKQYAVFYKDRAVAVIPGENGSRTIGINYGEKTWIPLTFQTSDSLVYSKMLFKLHEKYRK